MTDKFEFTLNNPLTEEQWDMIADVDFDRTDRIWFHTKHGKGVEFTKVIRCKDCKHWYKGLNINYCRIFYDNDLKLLKSSPDDYCSRAERKEE